jgi:hypothetical protein
MVSAAIDTPLTAGKSSAIRDYTESTARHSVRWIDTLVQ